MGDTITYLYEYLVIDKEDGSGIARFESNAAPPVVGSTIDVSEFMKSLNRPPGFIVVSVRHLPFKSDEARPSSKQTLIKLTVKPYYGE